MIFNKLENETSFEMNQIIPASQPRPGFAGEGITSCRISGLHWLFYAG